MTTVPGELFLRAHPVSGATNPAKTCAFQTPNNDRGLFKFQCLDNNTPCAFKVTQVDGQKACAAAVEKN